MGKNKDVSDFEKNGYVYFISANGKTKIGRSKSPESRINTIVSISGISESEVISGYFETGFHEKVETSCHHDKRISGERIEKSEWFNISAEMAKKVIRSHLKPVLPMPENYGDLVSQYNDKLISYISEGNGRKPNKPDLDFVRSAGLAEVAAKVFLSKSSNEWMHENIKGIEFTNAENMFCIYFYKMDRMQAYSIIKDIEFCTDEYLERLTRDIIGFVNGKIKGITESEHAND